MLSAPQSASAQVDVMVNNVRVNFGGVPPVQKDGRLLVPLRKVFEALGAEVEYVPASGQVKAQRGNTKLALTIGSPQAYINNQLQFLDVPPQIQSGRTLVPLRFVAESFGAQVKINSVTQAIEITTPTGSSANLPYNPPASTQVLNGTLVKVDINPPLTITVSINGDLRVLPVAGNALVLRQLSVASSATATPVRQPVRAINVSNLSSGDPLRITLNESNQVTQILASATVIIAQVQFAGGSQIILDDERDTALTIGPSLRYIDPKGKPAVTANLQPGQSVGLFISKTNNTIYQISAFPPDMAQAAGPQDPLGGQLPTAATPQIQVVQHDAAGSLKATAQLKVILRGTPGARASFSLGNNIKNVPLTEDAAHPGVYSTVYTVKPGEDVLNARITGKLTSGAGEDTRQSDDPVTIDTVAPRILGTFPANGAQINTAVPNLTVFADDLGGSGLAGASLEAVSGNGNAIRVNSTVAPPNSVNGVPAQPISGQVSVRGNVSDAAGNVTPVEWSFTIIQGTNIINSFTHGATRAVQPGEEIPLLLSATPAGRASFDVLNGRGTVLLRDQALVENQPGRYRGSFKVPANPPAVLRFVGKFVATDNTTGQLEATTRVEVVPPVVQNNLTVDFPTDELRVTSPLTVRGKAAPGATVDISVSAEGTQIFILGYREDLGTQQVRADGNGNWQSKPIELPERRNVADLHFVLTVRQTDAANRQSDPVTLTVRNK